MRKIRNINGSAAEGDDFFGRQNELVKLVRTLLTDSLLLTAPRRVGKSSLILRLKSLIQSTFSDPSFNEILKNHGVLDPARKLCFVPVYFNVEDCRTELEFSTKLSESLHRQGQFKPEILQYLADCIRALKENFGRSKSSEPGLDMVSEGLADSTTIRKLIPSLLRNIETQPNSGTAVIAIDELPEYLLQLERQQDGPRRVSEFLHWLKSLRDEFPQHVRWIFLGSIGLDNFVDQRSLSKTIHGLVPMSLGAWEPPEAHAFLEAIGPAVGLDLSADVRDEILKKIGWAIPYHLQIVIQSLIEIKSPPLPADSTNPVLTPVTAQDVTNAVNQLLVPHGYIRFDTWRQRLKDQLSTPDLTLTLQILKKLCAVPLGLTREMLSLHLLSLNPAADIDKTEQRLSLLLAMLQRDGYLIEQHGHYAFRSHLLREYWNRRELI